MIDLDVPKSQWVIQKNYFEAKLVNDFKHLYHLWFMQENNYDCITELQDAYNSNGELDRFVDKMSEKCTVHLYQFPPEIGHDTCDYFEKDDDDFVIPRHLFKLLES